MTRRVPVSTSRPFLVLLCVWSLLAISAPRVLVAQTAARDASVQEFVQTLQQVLARGDRQAVAGMVRYPLTITAAGLRIPIATASDFVGKYDQVMTPEIRGVIARIRYPATGGPPPEVVRDADGSVTLGGSVSIAPAGPTWKISNLAVTMGGSGGSTSTPGRSVGAPQRLAFRAGRPTQVNGALGNGQVDAYQLSAGQRQFLDVRIERVRGNEVVARIVDAKTGAPVNERAGTGARVWTGRLPAGGDYRIEISRQAGVADATLIYMLSVTLK